MMSAMKILKDKKLIEFKHDKMKSRDWYLRLYVRVPDSTVAAAKKIMKIKDNSAIPDSETPSPFATPDDTINDNIKENEKNIIQ